MITGMNARRLRGMQRRVIEGEIARRERDVLMWELSRQNNITHQEMADVLTEAGAGFGWPAVTRNNVQKIVQREDKVARDFQSKGRT